MTRALLGFSVIRQLVLTCWVITDVFDCAYEGLKVRCITMRICRVYTSGGYDGLGRSIAPAGLAVVR